MKKALFFLILSLVAAGLGYAAFQWQESHKTVLQENHGLPGGNFRLNGPDGPVSLSDFEGQPALIYFGYSYCPDICPTSLSVMAAAMNQLEAKGVEVQGIFISFDPERDSPETLKAYAPFFHPNIIGLTSDQYRILEVATRYGAYYQKVEREEGKDYLIDHTSRIYIIDQQGKLAALAPHGATPDEVVSKVLALL